MGMDRFDALIQQLGELETADAALQQLVAHGEAAVPVLTVALRDWRAFVRRRARAGLGQIGGDAAAAALCEVLQGGLSFWEFPMTGVFAETVQALVAIGSPAVEPLCQLLPVCKPTVRQLVVKGLGQIGDAQAKEPLLALLAGNRELGLNAQIIEALARFPTEPMIPTFVAALDRHPCEARLAAARALSILGWRPAGVEEHVLYGLACEDAEYVAARGEETIGPLCTLLVSGDRQQRAGAAECLGLIGRSEALPALRTRVRFTEGDREVARAILAAITAIEHATRHTAHLPRVSGAETPAVNHRPRASDEAPQAAGRPRDG